MPDARCTRGLVCKMAKENAHEHTGSAEALRHSLRNGFTAYFVTLPGDQDLFVTVAPRMMADLTPGWAGFASAGLDANHEASGPHDFAVRSSTVRQRAVDRSRTLASPPCHHVSRLTLPRPPHPAPRL